MTIRELVKLFKEEIDDWDDTEVKVHISHPHDGDDEVFDVGGIEVWNRHDGIDVSPFAMIVA